jgi:hypothetical protein
VCSTQGDGRGDCGEREERALAQGADFPVGQLGWPFLVLPLMAAIGVGRSVANVDPCISGRFVPVSRMRCQERCGFLAGDRGPPCCHSRQRVLTPNRPVSGLSLGRGDW